MRYCRVNGKKWTRQEGEVSLNGEKRTCDTLKDPTLKEKQNLCCWQIADLNVPRPDETA